MKKSTTAQKMRWVAGVLYLLLAVYQTLALNAVLLGTSFYNASFGWVAALALIPLAVAMSIWMLAGNKVLGTGTRRAVVVGTAWCVLYEIITYSTQTTLINYSLAQYLPSLADKQIWLYFFMIFRLLLMILAAFFVTGSRESMDTVTPAEEKAALLAAEAAVLAQEEAKLDEMAAELAAEEVAAVEKVAENLAMESALDVLAEAEARREDPEA